MAISTKVNIGELVIGKGDVNLVAYGVGSCVIVACYDREKEIAGMLHAILPEKPKKKSDPDKYVDSGVEHLVKLLMKEDVSIINMEAKIYGGARMFDIKTSGDTIGDRNTEKAREVLAKKGIPIAGEDTGSDYGRTVDFSVRAKKAVVKSFSKGSKEV